MFMQNRFKHIPASLGALGLVAAALVIFAEPVCAQQPPAANAATAAAPAAGQVLSLAEIEQRVAAQGIRVTEIEIHDRVVEVEGVDGSNREIDLVVDRRTGEILSRAIDE